MKTNRKFNLAGFVILSLFVVLSFQNCSKPTSIKKTSISSTASSASNINPDPNASQPLTEDSSNSNNTDNASSPMVPLDNSFPSATLANLERNTTETINPSEATNSSPTSVGPVSPNTTMPVTSVVADPVPSVFNPILGFKFKNYSKPITADQSFVKAGTFQTATSFSFQDTSIGDGTNVTKTSTRIKGIGSSNLRACSDTIENELTACLKDSDFVLLKDQSGWHYYSGADRLSTPLDDLYEISMNVDPNKPKKDEEYFTKFILPSGVQILVKYKALSFSRSSTTTDGYTGPNTNINLTVNQTIKSAGLGNELRACTVLESQKSLDCQYYTNNIDPQGQEVFKLLINQPGWSYNSNEDSYYNVSVLNVPNQISALTNYVSRFIFPDGRMYELVFNPLNQLRRTQDIKW